MIYTREQMKKYHKLAREHYSLVEIDKRPSLYKAIYGERSNGKTYAVIKKIISTYWSSNKVKKGALIRRWEEDIKPKNSAKIVNGLIEEDLEKGKLNEVKLITNGEFNTFVLKGRDFYLAHYDEETNEYTLDTTHFLTLFAITQAEHYKSNNYGIISIIIFDEFLTRGRHAPDEFANFMSILSTIIRRRTDVIIYMCGNTVNTESIYFKEMGTYNIETMTQGEIRDYKFKSGLCVSFEWCEDVAKSKGVKKPSNIYWGFDNPRLDMIKSGGWEFDIYPRLTAQTKYERKDVALIFFVVFNLKIIQCELVHKNNETFIFCYRKTTEMHQNKNDLIYTNTPLTYNNYRMFLNRPITKKERIILKLFQIGKIFYSDNATGELMRNYLVFCKFDSKPI